MRERQPTRLRSVAPGVAVVLMVLSALTGALPRGEAALDESALMALPAAGLPDGADAKSAGGGEGAGADVSGGVGVGQGPAAVEAVGEGAVEGALHSVKKQSVERDEVVIPGLYSEGTTAPIATVEWWEELAWCETAGNWEDRGRWSGGLGIYTQTWKYWGGLEFAPVAWKASKDEQIIVANRIASQGWVREDGSMKDPIGYSGWGAKHCAGDVVEVAVTDTRAYTEEQLSQARRGERREVAAWKLKMLSAFA